MADNSPYTDSVGLFKFHPRDEAAMADALRRVLNYGIPYEIYSDAMMGEGGTRDALDCALILENVIRAAVWGAMNARDILTIRQIEDTEDEEMGGVQE